MVCRSYRVTCTRELEHFTESNVLIYFGSLELSFGWKTQDKARSPPVHSLSRHRDDLPASCVGAGRAVNSQT